MSSTNGRGEAAGVGPSGSCLYRHLADDEIHDAIRFALEAVEELAPPDDLRGHVFNAAWGARTRYFGDIPDVVRVGRMDVPRRQG